MPTLGATVRDPFACPRCGQLWAKESRLQSATLLAASEEALLIASHNQLNRDGVEIRTDPLVQPDQMSPRDLRRFLVWREGPIETTFKEELFRYSGANGIEWESMTVVPGNSVPDTLRKLRRMLDPTAEHEIDYLVQRLRPSGPGIRLQGCASAQAVALCKTAFLYRCLYEIDGSLFAQSNRNLYSGLIFGQIPADTSHAVKRSLCRLEVLAVFAWALLEAVKVVRLEDVRWSNLEPQVKFLPACCVDHKQQKLRIRPRVNEASVRRLLRRYAHHRVGSEWEFLTN